MPRSAKSIRLAASSLPPSIHRGRAHFWRRTIAAWSKSGLSQAEFCRRRGIAPGSFAWWKREIRLRASAERPKSATTGPRRAIRDSRPAVDAARARFVRVRVRSSPTPVAAPATIEVIVSGGRQVRVGSDFDANALRKVIALLEELPC